VINYNEIEFGVRKIENVEEMRKIMSDKRKHIHIVDV
jgi:hypothetical protein